MNIFHVTIDDVYTSLPASETPCACTTVKELSRLLGRAYDTQLSGSGINVTQFAILRRISRSEGEPLARMARELEMDRTSLYRALSPMVRDGWLALSRPGHTRQARLTPKGKKLLANATNPWEKLQDRLIGNFGRKRYAALLSEISRLAECAREAEK